MLCLGRRKADVKINARLTRVAYAAPRTRLVRDENVRMRLTGWFCRSGSGSGSQAAAVEVPAPVRGGEFALYPPRCRKGLDPTARADFAKRLAAFRGCVERLSQPRLQSVLILLDFGQIRERFASQWENVREKVMLFVEHALDRMLGERDLYLVRDESHAYLFVAGVRRADAEVRARVMASELTQRLCGLVPGGIAIRVRTLPFDFRDGLRDVVGIRQLEERIADYNRRAERSEREIFEACEPALRLYCRPVVQHRKGLITALHLETYGRDERGNAIPAQSICPEQMIGAFDAEVDRWAAGQAGRLLESGKVRHRRLLVLPVHYETLATRSFRERFFEACRSLPAHSEHQFVFEILDLPPGMPQCTLENYLSYLRPFCFGFAIRIHPEIAMAEPAEGCAVRFVSVDLEPDREFEAWRGEGLKGLAHCARSAGKRVVALGLRDADRLRAAVAAGIEYLAGDCVAPADRSPPSCWRSKRHRVRAAAVG